MTEPAQDDNGEAQQPDTTAAPAAGEVKTEKKIQIPPEELDLLVLDILREEYGEEDKLAVRSALEQAAEVCRQRKYIRSGEDLAGLTSSETDLSTFILGHLYSEAGVLLADQPRLATEASESGFIKFQDLNPYHVDTAQAAAIFIAALHKAHTEKAGDKPALSGFKEWVESKMKNLTLADMNAEHYRLYLRGQEAHKKLQSIAQTLNAHYPEGTGQLIGILASGVKMASELQSKYNTNP